MKRVFPALISLALAFILLVSIRLHRPGGPGTVHAQLRYLEGALGDAAAERMQRLFPEGYVFTWSLYGLASARTAGELDEGDARRDHLLAETRRALAAIHSEKGRKVFDATLDPPYGAFHASWSLYVLAEYVRAVGPARVPPAVAAEFTRQCDRFARALAASGTPFLASYPEQVWPADTAPGIAALGIHDALFAPRYTGTIRRWVAAARARLDAPMGALSHQADPVTGAPLGGVRGESLALVSRLLVDADSAFARQQYALLREHFLDDAMGFRGMREYPRGVDGPEDMDTGPIVFGFSGPAVVVGAAAARVHGDLAVADALLGGVEVLGMPVQFGRRRVYAGGELPVGDAFIAWARTAPTPGPRPWAPVRPWWFVPFHAVSAVVAGVLVWWGRGRAPSRRRKRS